MVDMNRLVDEAPFKIVASCIRKHEFKQRHGGDGNPYQVALEFGLERVFYELQECGYKSRLTNVVFERRGRKEDDELELEFRRILDRSRIQGMRDALMPVFADKQANSAGLQLADMVARPIGRQLMRPDQPNRAFEVLRTKFRRDCNGNIEGWGLKCYP